MMVIVVVVDEVVVVSLVVVMVAAELEGGRRVAVAVVVVGPLALLHFGALILEPDLDAGRVQVGCLGEQVSVFGIRVVGRLEGLFEGVKLLATESGSLSSLKPHFGLSAAAAAGLRGCWSADDD